MKKIFKKPLLLPFLLMATVAATLVRCDKSEDLTPREKAMKIMMSKEWKIKTVTLDGLDVTSDFVGMKISFTDKTYTTTSGEPVWQLSDTWMFFYDTKKFNRGDGVEVHIQELSKSSMVLQLEWEKTTFGQGGRLEAISGTYVFTFE